MEEWDTEMRWRVEEADDWFFHLAAVENQLHLLAPVQEMVTFAPADAKNSSPSVQFERTPRRSAPLTDRLETFRVDVAEGREEEVDGKGEQEKRTREEMKTHSRRLILRKPS